MGAAMQLSYEELRREMALAGMRRFEGSDHGIPWFLFHEGPTQRFLKAQLQGESISSIEEPQFVIEQALLDLWQEGRRRDVEPWWGQFSVGAFVERRLRELAPRQSLRKLLMLLADYVRYLGTEGSLCPFLSTRLMVEIHQYRQLCPREQQADSIVPRL